MFRFITHAKWGTNEVNYLSSEIFNSNETIKPD